MNTEFRNVLAVAAVLVTAIGFFGPSVDTIMASTAIIGCLIMAIQLAKTK